jgi:hypothetical protein
MAASQLADGASVKAERQKYAHTEGQIDEVEHERTPTIETAGYVALSASAFDGEEFWPA